MRPTCDTPIRLRPDGDWRRCTAPPEHDGPHGLADGNGQIVAEAVDAPLYLGQGGRNPQRRRVLETRQHLGHPLIPGATFAEYRKTTTVYAAPVPERFTVATLEGIHEGQAGDYLAVGIEGELYPIAADIMASTYEEIDR